jgi:hypothetical protein
VPELTIEALAAAVAAQPAYRPATELADGHELRSLSGTVAGLREVGLDRVAVLEPSPDGVDVSSRALAALGRPVVAGQPVYLVRPEPEAGQPFVATLARLVHELDWPAGDDLGVTHLEELGGVLVFELLSWLVDPAVGATVLIVDEPLFADSADRPSTVSAVALRIGAGGGPIRVLDWGEGTPGAVAAHVFLTGTGPCDAWLALHAALRAGRIAAGDRVLLRTRGPRREGWVLVEVPDVTLVDPVPFAVPGMGPDRPASKRERGGRR